MNHILKSKFYSVLLLIDCKQFSYLSVEMRSLISRNTHFLIEIKNLFRYGSNEKTFGLAGTLRIHSILALEVCYFHQIDYFINFNKEHLTRGSLSIVMYTCLRVKCTTNSGRYSAFPQCLLCVVEFNHELSYQIDELTLQKII